MASVKTTATDFRLTEGHRLVPVLDNLWHLDAVRGLMVSKDHKRVLVLLERDHEAMRPEIGAASRHASCYKDC